MAMKLTTVGGAAVAGALLALAMATTGIAQTKPEPAEITPEQGRKIAERLCTNCHVVDEKAPGAVPAGIPSFRGIANKKGQTGQHILNVLINPHTPMPDLQLTTDEILAIVSYLETLRTDPSMLAEAGGIVGFFVARWRS